MVGGKVLEPEFFPSSPDDDGVSVTFSSQCCVEHCLCLHVSQLQTTPVVLVTTLMAVPIWVVQRPPWLLNVSNVSSLSLLQASSFSASWEQPFLLSLWFYGEKHRLLSLWSLSAVPFPQLLTRDSKDHAKWTDVMAHIQTAAVLAARSHLSPFKSLKYFLPPCV